MPPIKNRRLTRDMKNDKLNELVRHLYSTGATYSEIAEATGCTRSAIAGRCDRLGLKGRGPSGPQAYKRTDESISLDTRLRELAEMGLSGVEISERVYLTVNAVYSRLRKLGLGGHRVPGRRAVRRRPNVRVPNVQPDPEPVLPPDPTTAIAFSKAEGCRYALWANDEHDLDQKRVCGGRVSRGSYCAFHGAMVYVTLERRAA